jgi:hypothetical protein
VNYFNRIEGKHMQDITHTAKHIVVAILKPITSWEAISPKQLSPKQLCNKNNTLGLGVVAVGPVAIPGRGLTRLQHCSSGSVGELGGRTD